MSAQVMPLLYTISDALSPRSGFQVTQGPLSRGWCKAYTSTACVSRTSAACLSCMLIFVDAHITHAKAALSACMNATWHRHAWAMLTFEWFECSLCMAARWSCWRFCCGNRFAVTEGDVCMQRCCSKASEPQPSPARPSPDN